MKRKFVLILTAMILCLSIGLTACGGTGGGKTNGGGDDDTPTDTLTFERNEAGTGYIVTGDQGEDTKIVIPETHDSLPVVEIGESAFAYSRHKSDILSVTIPDSVTKIGLNAFYNQDALESVNIGTNSKLKTIENNAFSGNHALKSFYLPEGVIELGDSVFNNCGSLDRFTVASGNTAYSGEGNNLIDLATHTIIRGTNKSEIPSTVTGIGVAAFRRANGISKLYIPRSVISIEKYAFADSTIERIEYEGSETEWNNVQKGTMWDLHCTLDVKFDVQRDEAAANILVAYFSATGTTRGVAEKIAKATGGTLFEIVPAVPYTAADLDYGTDCRANREQRDDAARPEIKSSVSDMGAFDVVYLGYPIWWSKAPKIIYTFLESYDFSGKTIVPFCTSGSSSINGSLSEIQALASGSTWLSGRRFEGNVAQSNVETWVNSFNTDS